MSERILLDAGEKSVLVIDGRVAAVGPEASALRRAEGLTVLDCSGSRIEPGEVNAHTHLYSGLAPLGMPPPAPAPENFLQILERVWWRLDRALDEKSLRASARLYLAEALLAGTTTVVDHHESPSMIDGSLDVLAEAAGELGARVALGYGATERNGKRAEAKAGLAECARLARRAHSSRILPMVALHASFTVSDETVREAGALAKELGVPMHVHVAEDLADVEDARRRGFRSPLYRLDELGALPRGSVIAHGVHLDETEMRRAEELGCWVVQNPRSNKGNRVGYPKALGAIGSVAVGTDGYPADMSVELLALLGSAKENGDDRVLSDPKQFLARRSGGWRLVGSMLDRSRLSAARLEPPVTAGNLADLVVAGEEAPRHVLVDGRVVVRDGKLVGADLEAIRAEARSEAARLWRRMDAL